MEGVCSLNARKFYISNERVQNVITTPARFQTINLGPLLNPYYNSLATVTQAAAIASNGASGNSGVVALSK